MDALRFGNLIRARREAKGWEIPELARFTKLGAGVLGKYGRGERIHPIDPEDVNAIAGALANVSVLELVMAMGYQVQIAGFSPEELALVDQYRRLHPALREGLRATAQALEGQLQGVEPEG